MAGSQASGRVRINRRFAIGILFAACFLANTSCQVLSISSPEAESRLPEKASPTTPPKIETNAPTLTLELSTPTSVPTVNPEPLVLTAGSSRYILPPTVQYIGAKAATIVFEIETIHDLGLLYWEAGTEPRNGVWIPLPSMEGVQVIQLVDLMPGTNYSAAIVESMPGVSAVVPTLQGEIWDPIQIHTLPEAGFPLRIVVMGDSGFGQDVTHELAQAMADQMPDLFIHTGDLVYNAYQEGSPPAAFQYKWFQTHAPILREATVLPVVGNHEMYDDALWEGQPYYYHAFPPFDPFEGEPGQHPVPEGLRDWYQLALGDIQFLFLNTQYFFRGGMRNEQDQWLEERLSDSAYQSSIVVFHVPPYTSGRHRLDGTAVVRSWVPLFEAYHVPLVLSGHDHNYEHLQQNGVNYIVSGGGSSVLYEQGIPLAISQQFFYRSHYLLIDLEAETLSVTAYASDGSKLDAFVIDLN